MSGIELAMQIAIGCQVPIETSDSPLQIWHGLGQQLKSLTLIQQPLVVIVDHYDDVDHTCHQAVCRLRQAADTAGTKLTLVLAARDRQIPTLLQDHVELAIDLAPWTADETTQFIQFSLARANCKTMLFTDEAVTAVYHATNGIPNQIVMLCTLALLAAKGQDEQMVTSECVAACADELPRRTIDPSASSRWPAARPLAGSASR